jgi:cellulose synthase/poly-beta-1,6-N-acetylglucosamine synthase-like glycosyltransferase
LVYWAIGFLSIEIFWPGGVPPTSPDGLVAGGVILLGSIAGTWLAIESSERRRGLHRPAGRRYIPRDVAVIIAAHNEEKLIGRTLAAISKSVPHENIFVGNDASQDKTSSVVTLMGCQVLDLVPNRGKAKVLRTLLDHYHLLDRFPIILILDADIEVHEDFLARALPHFDDPRVVAVPGRSRPRWPSHHWPRQNVLITAYRTKLWRMMQFGLRYGQTWKYTNMSTIIPGAMSLYRSSALRQIDIDAPGLVIEDFNMTFELHHRRLGRIAYDARAQVNSQQPQTVGDYVRQIRRWYLGWWQTVRRHGVWASGFWFFMASFTLEMVVNAVFVLLVPIMAIVIGLNHWQPVAFPAWQNFNVKFADVTITGLVLSVLVVDYASTLLIAAIDRKPLMALYGLVFFPLRFLDALMFLVTLPVSLFVRSDGRWTSPTRAAAPSAPGG